MGRMNRLPQIEEHNACDVCHRTMLKGEWAEPTNAQLKVDRAIDLFNESEHPRTIAGIARTLGPPRGSAVTSPESAAEVLLTIAWELSWYQFTVDLSDPREPVALRSRGQE